MQVAADPRYKMCLSVARSVDVFLNLGFVILMYKIAITPNEEDFCDNKAMRWLFLHTFFS